MAFVFVFVFAFTFAYAFAFVLIKLSNVQVNHHGKTITVGGKEDADTELLVERVRTKTKGGTNGGIEGGGTSATPQRHNCGNCQMAVVRTLDRGDILIPQVYLLSQVFSRENLGVDGGKVKVIAWQNHIWDRRESDDLETLIQSLNPPHDQEVIIQQSHLEQVHGVPGGSRHLAGKLFSNKMTISMFPWITIFRFTFQH